MRRPTIESRLRVIRLLLTWQLVVAFGAGLAGLAVAGTVAGSSAVLGGLICWLPSCWFAYRAFRYRGARAAMQIVRSFYAGEAGKLILTAALFTLVFINIETISASALFAGFASVQLVNWIVPLVAARAEVRNAAAGVDDGPNRSDK